MTKEAQAIVMPLMGEGITEATLVKWLKKPGEKVRKDEPLLEVSTDKVDSEIASSYEGVIIKTLVTEGSSVKVNSIIGYVGESMDAVIPQMMLAESAAASKVEKQSSRPVRQLVEQRSSDTTLRSTPIVRGIAREMNLNLGAVLGSGVQGRITRKDVLAFLEKLREETGVADESHSALQTTVVDGQEYLEGVKVRREPMSRMRSLIAKHMLESVRTSPHVTTTFEMDMHRMVEYREKNLESIQKQYGVKLTYTHLISYACTQVLKKHPLINASVDGQDILYKDDIHLGVAVAIDTGLIVPVVKKAQEKSLIQMAQSITDLAARARSKKLQPEDIQGGTFSITNPGLFGSLHSNPIINQPQVAILSVGAMIKRPVVMGNDITIRPLIQIGLTFDHRIIDGEGGAKFLADLKKAIEEFSGRAGEV